MTDPITLANQCEQAAPEQTRELLEQAWAIIREPEPPHHYGRWFEWVAWSRTNDRFKALLNINTEHAFIGAAMMLRPEGWSSQVSENPASAYATVCPPDAEDYDDAFSAGGRIAALALTAAALRAHAAGKAV